MTSDRQLWSLGGLSAVATFVVLLGASGAGGDITRAAAAVLGARPAEQAAAVSATTPADDAAADDSLSSSSDDTADTATVAGASGTATAAADDGTATTETADDTEGGGSGGTGPAATTADTRVASRIKHVFIVTLAGQGVDATFGAGSAAPYLSGELRPKGVLLSGFSSLGSSAIADRLALVSGQPPNAATRAGCSTYSQIPPLTSPDKNGIVAKDGCVYPNTVVTVAEQLQGKRLTWKDYAEDLDKGPRGAAATCRRPDSDKPDDTVEPRPGDTYTTRNVPWAYFRASIDVASCDTGVVPLTKLETDLKSVASTPNLVYISPGVCSDGSRGACTDGAPGGLAAADAFLRQIVPGILASPAYQQDGLLVITFAGGPGPGDAPSKNGTVLLSPFLTGGASNDTVYDPYSLLRTIEDLFVLPKYLAKAQGAKSFADDVLASARPVQAGDD